VARATQRRGTLATALPIANFLSYFAIAAVEFSVPFVAVSTLGANSLVIAGLGICRFAPQVLLARAAARVVERYDQRTVMLGSELLRVVAFILSAFALAVAPSVGLGVFGVANVALACASVLTAVSTQVLVPAVFADEMLPSVYFRLGIAESSADALAPFFTGLGLGALGVSPTFGVAAALAVCACALLLRVPQIRVQVEPPGRDEVVITSRATLRRGLQLNLHTSPLRIITVWAVSYNFGQCIIEALLLVALVKHTPITSTSYGVIRTCAVLFAVLGAYLAERLPTRLRSGLGTSLFGCGAVASYAVVGVGVYVGGMTGLVLVLVGFAVDEFCSGVVLVRIQAFRARAIARTDRAIAVAAYRAVNMTAVPAGFAVGGLIGLVLSPASTLLAVGLLMILPGILILSRSVRETA
jgi:hypothetical protein